MACYRHHRLLILCLTSFLLLSSTTADDDAVMLRLSTFISPTPPTWNTINFCLWEGISCDDSNRVISINLASKSLTGVLPPNLNQLDQLKTLALQRNFFSGPLPTLAKLTHLEQVILDSNNFSSIPSDFLLGLTNLQSFSISDNIYLSPWLLPTDLNQSSSLQTFEASSAKLTGSIPEIFDSFPNLHTLRLSYNSLTGTLPETFSGSRIVNLYLNNQFQGLSGTIDVISSMIKLNQVWLHANSFTGAIPELSELTDLFDLQLWDNQFTGLVPPSLTTLPKLANITLRNNKLQGPLPVFGDGVLSELGIESNRYCLDTPGVCDHQVTILLDVAGAIGYPVLLSEFWQGNDACRRWKFVICDSSGKNVTGVNFGKMNFSGSISPSFANLTSLKILSLNDNNLVGSIPETLTSLPDLQSLDVSNNNLSGVMPKFPKTVRVLYQNNLLLGQNIPNTSVSYSSPSGQLKGTHVSAGMVIGIVIGVLVLVGIVLFVSYKCYIKSIYQMFGRVGDLENGKELVKGGITGSNGFEIGNVMISVQVLREVTDNFNEDNVLGRGGVWSRLQR